MRWYVVHVKTGDEQKIAEKLSGAGFRTLVPAENRLVRSGGSWGQKEYTLFPGYIFLQMCYNAENYYRLKSIPGIINLLNGTLSYLEAEWILLLSGQDGRPLEPSLVRMVDGSLEIETGVLKNFQSRIIQLDKRSRRALIEISICGEKKEVQLGIRLDTETGNEQIADG